MSQLDSLRERFPEAAKDLKLNLGSIFQAESLTPDQVWGTAYCCALFVRSQTLAGAIAADAAAVVSPEVLEDAKAAAAIMGMNTILYRFRHLVHKESYAHRPARLRMQRMMSPQTNKTTFELMSLACAALAGCETCIRAHEEAVLNGGLTEQHVHEVVRIASVISGAAIAAEMSG
jgi:alkyl hydroperoxide reductase subunit D